MPEVSVVVPVYKAEQYLPKCVESLLAQTFANFELILVDDGSPDGCPALCDRYASGDPRVRVVHQANSGVSAARNAGIAAARGAWMCFVDSDDWVGERYLETLVGATASGRFDLVLSGVKSVEQGREVAETAFADAAYSEQNFAMLFSELKVYYYAAPHGKIFRADAVRQNNVRFNPELKYGEDLFFMLDFLVKSHNVRTISQSHYYYNLDTPSSLSKRVNTLATERAGHEVSKRYGDLFARYGTKAQLGLDLLEVGSLRRMIRAIYQDCSQRGRRIQELKRLDVALLRPARMAQGVWKVRVLDLLLVCHCWRTYDFLVTRVAR